MEKDLNPDRDRMIISVNVWLSYQHSSAHLNTLCCQLSNLSISIKTGIKKVLRSKILGEYALGNVRSCRFGPPRSRVVLPVSLHSGARQLSQYRPKVWRRIQDHESWRPHEASRVWILDKEDRSGRAKILMTGQRPDENTYDRRSNAAM